VAKNFWSLVLYDYHTRSMLQTDQQVPSISSQKKGVVIYPDTSVDVYFGPKPPPGKESNWVQTWPGKGWKRSHIGLDPSRAIPALLVSTSTATLLSCVNGTNFRPRDFGAKSLYAVTLP
jgi:Protein of unknown function (DUF1214)